MTQDNSPNSDAIAIIGMACRVPGAKTVDQFWNNLQNGVESIVDLTPEQLIQDGIDPSLMSVPGYVNRAAILDGVEEFDAAFFGYTPVEARLMDPQHRLFLECSYWAFEDAGYDPTRYPGAVGVFGGVARNGYLTHNLATKADLRDRLSEYELTLGNEKDFPATRVAFKLNLKGPVVSVQTACSTSGVALHLACQSLLTGESEMALVAGCRVNAPMRCGYVPRVGSTLSTDGHCRAFDAHATGMIRGNGAAAIIVKRLDDAIRDGDTVRAIIRGTAINNDGSDKVGFTAPSVSGQAAVIREALEISETDARSISYVEAHGTGTALGDPIEVAALTQAFREDTADTGFCRIGSVKTNIGHLDAAAGLAGVIKTVLAMENRVIPPSLNFSSPNPEIDFERSPFVVNGELTEWNTDVGPRRAGVSSFGLGGTNSHVILEEAPALARGGSDADPAADTSKGLIVLSAKTETALDSMAGNLGSFLEANPDVPLSDASFTLQTGRGGFTHRRAVAGTRGEIVAELSGEAGPLVSTGSPLAGDVEVAFMFTGQGAQYPSMGRGVYDQEPVYREAFDRCCSLFSPLLEHDLKELVFPPEGQEDEAGEILRQTAFAQPALFAVEYAMAQLWMNWGVKPQAMIGHSIGEYVAACLSGVFTLDQAVEVVANRGRLMQSMPTGAMIAVSAPAEEVQGRLGTDTCVATVNTPRACVVSGPEAAIEEAATRLEKEGIDTRRLRTSHAFHSPMMDPILEEFERVVASVGPRAPRIPIVSNVSGTWLTDQQAQDPSYWSGQLRNPVLFAAGVKTLAERTPVVALEMGPGSTLCAFARQSGLTINEAAVVPSLRKPKDSADDGAFVLEALGKAWIAGLQPDWRGVHRGRPRRRVRLPSYPFEQKPHWVDATPLDSLPATGAAAGSEEGGVHHLEATGQSDQGVAETGRPTTLDRLKGLLHELSGLEVDEMPGRASFLELGFDSLFLTRAGATIKKVFGVDVTFRQFLDEAPTLETLADYIEERLPADSVVGHGADSALQAAPPAEGQSLSTDVGETALPPKPEKVGHGPWKPIDARKQGLSEEQRRHFDALVQRYTERTRGSKELTGRQRRHLSDPRAVTGFRREWKEMTYQIAVERSKGGRLWDVDGNEYVDLIMGLGINFFGHSPDFIREAVKAQADRCFTLGLLTPLAQEVADDLCDFVGLERANFVNTGSEAVSAAVRAARTVTGRDRIVVFGSDYHGISDELLVRDAGGRSIPVAPGIPESLMTNVVVLDYDDPRCLEKIRGLAGTLAAVIIEPVPASDPSMDLQGVLEGIRAITEEEGVALIFDELITGFRLHPRGAQGWYGIDADLVAYGKVLSGGLPMAAVAGKARFMDAFDGGPWQFGDDSYPEKGVTFFGGTFVRHPLSLAAAKAVLEQLRAGGPALQENLNRKTEDFAHRLRELFLRTGAPMTVKQCSSMILISVEPGVPNYRLMYFYLREAGVHLTERAGFLSTAHTDEDLEFMLERFENCIGAMQEAGFFPAADGTPVAPEEWIPLSESQQELWIGAQSSTEANCSFNLSNVLTLDGPVDLEAMAEAIRSLVSRHGALRARISPDGESQTVDEVIDVSIPVHDVRGDPDRLARLKRQQVSEPFDLYQGPLVRAALVIEEDDRVQVFLTVHHIICDGWSCGILVRDLAALYKAGTTGREPDLPPATPFPEVVERLTKLGENPAAREYWLDQFADSIPAMDLPTDRPRPPIRTVNADRIDGFLSGPLLERLKELAVENGCTLYSMLFAAFSGFLGRVTQQADFTVGISAAAQVNDPTLVGHGVQLLPLRVGYEPAQPFNEFLGTVRDDIFSAFEHQGFTYGTLLKDLAVKRDSSRMPLVSVVFNMDTVTAAKDLDFGEASVEVGSNPRLYEAFEWFFNIVPTDDGLQFQCTFNSDLFSRTGMRRRLDEFSTFLTGIGESPQAPVGDLPVLSEKDILDLTAWNQTAAPIPDQSLHGMVIDQCLQTPEAVAVVDGEVTRTYADLNAESARFAEALRGEGVEPGDVVGICVDRTGLMAVGVLGILRAGAAYLPLDPRFPAERLAFMAEDAAAKVIVTDEPSLGSLPPFSGPVVRIDRPFDDPTDRGGHDDCVPDLADIATAPDSLAYLIYTSGSTGKPKGVRVMHEGAVNLLASFQGQMGVTPDDGLLAITTLSFDISVVELFLPLVCGARVVIAADRDARDGVEIARLLETHEITILQGTPSTWRMIIEGGWDGTAGLTAISGGEPLARDLASDMLARTGAVWNGYGPTEATVYATTYQVTGEEESIPIGRPISNTEIYVVDERKEPVPIGSPGELCIGGTGLAAGYLNREELTNERFVQLRTPNGEVRPAYRTGDIARLDHQGTVYCFGRSDDQVKVRGFRIELGEIESVLNEHPAVTRSALTVYTPGNADTRLVAHLLLEGGKQPDVEAFRSHLRLQLPEYMIPQHFMVHDRFPLLPNGKTDRSKLPLPHDDDLRPEGRHVDPETDTEKALSVIWQEILGTATVGVTDHFFDLGGHSLLATRLLSRIGREFGHQFPFSAILDTPTIRSLGERLDAARYLAEADEWESAETVEIDLDDEPEEVPGGSDANPEGEQEGPRGGR